MARAQYKYDANVLHSIMQDHNLTQAELARITCVSERHITNILSGQTSFARFKTVRKFIDSLTANGVNEKNAKSIFFNQP